MKHKQHSEREKKIKELKEACKIKDSILRTAINKRNKLFKVRRENQATIKRIKAHNFDLVIDKVDLKEDLSKLKTEHRKKVEWLKKWKQKSIGQLLIDYPEYSKDWLLYFSKHQSKYEESVYQFFIIDKAFEDVIK